MAMFGGPVLACVPPEMAKMMRGGALSLTTRDPIYVPVTVTYNGKHLDQGGDALQGQLVADDGHRHRERQGAVPARFQPLREG